MPRRTYVRELDVFGRLLLAHRQRLALTQEQLATKTGLSARAIRNLESGRARRPQAASVRLLADAMGLHGPERERFCWLASGHGDGSMRLTLDPASAVPSRDHRLATQPQPAVAATSPGAIGCPPRYLPRGVPDFVGRSALLAELLAAIASHSGGAAPRPTVVAIDGMAGAGKTSLALELTRRVTGWFPDGELFVDLRGHSTHRPVDPGAALATLLRQLGVAAARIPADGDERAALWRAELLDRRVLILLDNAADSAQVVPLLPASSPALVIVTSRRRLAGLDGARAASVDLLSPAEAVELLHRVVGGRVQQAPAAAAELAELCGRLPLALRLAAVRLVHRPSWTVADLNRRLRGAAERFSHLAAEGRDVGGAFALSYRQLDEVTQRVFRLCAVHPPAAFGPRVVAALAEVDVTDAARRLEELVDAHMLQSPAAERYRLHDLLHAHASVLLAADPPECTEAALVRLFDHYLHASARATAHFELPSGRASLTLGEPPAHLPVFDSEARAVGWLDTEWLNVIATLELAELRGHDGYVWRLARALWPYLPPNGHRNELMEVQQRALRAANRVGDEAAVATAHNYLASGYAETYRLESARAHLEQAWAIRQRLGDVRGMAATLCNLAALECYFLCRPARAVEVGLQALELIRGAGLDDSRCRLDLGWAYATLGRHQESLVHLHQALLSSRRRHDAAQEAKVLGALGRTRCAMGHHHTAVALLTRAIAAKRAAGNRRGAAESLSTLGTAYRGLGRHDDALACHDTALAAIPEGSWETRLAILNDYGEAKSAAGDFAGALALHRQALAEAQQFGHDYYTARAFDGIAVAIYGDDPDASRAHWRLALERYERMGVPEALTVRQRLAEREHGTHERFEAEPSRLARSVRPDQRHP